MNGKNGTYLKGLAGTQNRFLTPLIYFALAIKKERERESFYHLFFFFQFFDQFPPFSFLFKKQVY